MHFAALGFRAAALGARGYGRSSKPSKSRPMRCASRVGCRCRDRIGRATAPAVGIGRDWRRVHRVAHSAASPDRSGPWPLSASAACRSTPSSKLLEPSASQFYSDLLPAEGVADSGTGIGHRSCAAQDVFRAVRRIALTEMRRVAFAPGGARLLAVFVDPQADCLRPTAPTYASPRRDGSLTGMRLFPSRRRRRRTTRSQAACIVNASHAHQHEDTFASRNASPFAAPASIRSATGCSSNAGRTIWRSNARTAL